MQIITHINHWTGPDWNQTGTGLEPDRNQSGTGMDKIVPSTVQSTVLYSCTVSDITKKL